MAVVIHRTKMRLLASQCLLQVLLLSRRQRRQLSQTASKQYLASFGYDWGRRKSALFCARNVPTFVKLTS